jgi:hypothetical protein
MNQMTMYLIAIGFETIALLILWVRQVNHRAAIQELLDRTVMLAEAFNHMIKDVHEIKEQEREQTNA